MCPMCNAFEENEDHLFKECSTVKELRAHLTIWWKDGPLSKDNLNEIMGVNTNLANSNRGIDITDAASRAYLSGHIYG